MAPAVIVTACGPKTSRNTFFKFLFHVSDAHGRENDPWLHMAHGRARLGGWKPADGLVAKGIVKHKEDRTWAARQNFNGGSVVGSGWH